MTPPVVMPAATMDTAANENEVRLREGMSLDERLVLAGVAVFLCLLAIPGLVDLADGKWPVALLALLFGYSLLGGAVGRNVIWIITPEGILIGEQRPFRPLHRRLIRKDNILEMHLRANPTSSASPSKSDQKT